MRCRACDTVWLVSGPPADGAAEKRAAVSRRGAEREKRDLFAAQPLDHGSVKETVRPPPPRFETTLATRNENSVLFKVTDVFGGNSARVKTPEPAPASVAPAPPGRDDSGVIDLKALSERPPSPAARPVVAPLFGMSEPPPAAFARDAGASSMYPAQAPVRSKLRTAGLVLAAAAFVAVIGVGVTAMFKAGEPEPRAAAAAPPPPAPPPPPAVTAPPPAPEPAPAESASSASHDKPVATGKKGRRGHGAGKSAKTHGLITNTSPPPPARKVKAADPCGCHGDFNCILACTAGKK